MKDASRVPRQRSESRVGLPVHRPGVLRGEHLSDRYHVWTCPDLLKDFQGGDFIWVRATLPLGAFIGLGEVISDLAPDTGGRGYRFDVFFDERMSAAMAAKPVHGILEKHTQATRRLTSGELRALHRQVGAPRSARHAPAGKVRRMQRSSRGRASGTFVVN